MATQLGSSGNSSSGSSGALLLALPAVTEAVARFYIRMTKHKNHMVVEAACAAIAELGEWLND